MQKVGVVTLDHTIYYQPPLHPLLGYFHLFAPFALFCSINDLLHSPDILINNRQGQQLQSFQVSFSPQHCIINANDVE